MKHVPRQHSLRAVDNVNVGVLSFMWEPEIGPGIRQPATQLLCRADRRRRFQNYKRISFEKRSYRQRRLLDVANVRHVVITKRSRHGDDICISSLWGVNGPQPSGGNNAAYHGIQLGLDYVYPAPVYRIDDRRLNIVSNDLGTMCGQDRGSGEADITQAYDRNSFKIHGRAESGTQLAS